MVDLTDIQRQLEDKDSVSTQEAADLLGISQSSIRRWIKTGKLSATKVKRVFSIPASEIVRLASKAENSDFSIPTTVEQGPPTTNAGWDSAGVLKTSDSDFDASDLYNTASAITQYVFEKELSKPGRSWQDFILHQQLLQKVVLEQVKRHLEAGDPPVIAQLKATYSNFPDLKLSEEEQRAVEKYVTDSSEEKEDLTYKDVAAHVFKITNHDFDPEHLVTREQREELDAQKQPFLRLSRDRLVGIVEGVVASLIAAGLFELLREALASLVIRAPYTEAQIYEVECDVIRTMKKWHKATRGSFRDATELTDSDRDLLLMLILHAIVVASVYGVTLPDNPLCNTDAGPFLASRRDYDQFLERWMENRNGE